MWDAFNRLVAVARKSDGAAIAAYSYLPDGRRSRKVVFSQTNPGVVERDVRFAWDGAQEVEEQNAAGVTLATFVWSPVYVDELVEFRREAAHPLGAGSYYAHQDTRCDVVAVTNASGVVVEKRRYDDFGREEIRDAGGVVVAASPSGLEYGFQGRRRDSETGWLYFRARFYDPETGRFLSRDPVWDAGNVGGWYTFVGNGPVSRRDPLGLADPVPPFNNDVYHDWENRFATRDRGMPLASITQPANEYVEEAMEAYQNRALSNEAGRAAGKPPSPGHQLLEDQLHGRLEELRADPDLPCDAGIDDFLEELEETRTRLRAGQPIARAGGRGNYPTGDPSAFSNELRRETWKERFKYFQRHLSGGALAVLAFFTAEATGAIDAIGKPGNRSAQLYQLAAAGEKWRLGNELAEKDTHSQVLHEFSETGMKGAEIAAEKYLAKLQAMAKGAPRPPPKKQPAPPPPKKKR